MKALRKWQSVLMGLGLLAMSNVAFAEDVLDTGDTAWVLVSTALVLMMTLPGLALFYAGMVRKKNILSTMMHSYGATAVVSVLWVVLGYSLAFSEGSMNAFVGGFANAMLAGVGLDDISGTIPVILFVIFQLTFAVITVAILAGSLAERTNLVLLCGSQRLGCCWFMHRFATGYGAVAG